MDRSREWFSLVVACFALVAITVADVLTPSVRLSPFLAVPVLLSAVRLRSSSTLWLGVCALGCSLASDHDTNGHADADVRFLLLTFAVVSAVVLARQRETAERALTTLVMTDPLTGLPNRRAATEHLTREVARHDVAVPVTVLFVDLDGFKTINDTYGHECGDAVLVHVAERLRWAAGTAGLVTRYAGDEFVLISNALHNEQAVEVLCRRVAAAIAEPVRLQEHLLAPRASIGAALARRGQHTVDGILAAADAAMFTAKATRATHCVVVVAD